jgi:hypothetical protein
MYKLIGRSIDEAIKCPFRAETLIESVDNIIKAYKCLNSLHTRGRMDDRAARQALFTIKHFIAEFTESIE